MEFCYRSLLFVFLAHSSHLVSFLSPSSQSLLSLCWAHKAQLHSTNPTRGYIDAIRVMKPKIAFLSFLSSPAHAHRDLYKASLILVDNHSTSISFFAPSFPRLLRVYTWRYVTCLVGALVPYASEEYFVGKWLLSMARTTTATRDRARTLG